MTGARGSMKFPAAPTPGTLVSQVLSTATPAVEIDVAAEADKQGLIGMNRAALTVRRQI